MSEIKFNVYKSQSFTGYWITAQNIVISGDMRRGNLVARGRPAVTNCRTPKCDTPLWKWLCQETNDYLKKYF